MSEFIEIIDIFDGVKRVQLINNDVIKYIQQINGDRAILVFKESESRTPIEVNNYSYCELRAKINK